jgi:hypothetical protein
MAHAVLGLSWAAQICNAVALEELGKFHGMFTQRHILTLEQWNEQKRVRKEEWVPE